MSRKSQGDVAGILGQGFLGQGFPVPGAPICDPQTGRITGQWLSLLATLLNRTGGTAPIPATLPQASAMADLGAMLALFSDMAEPAPKVPAPGLVAVSLPAGADVSGHRALMWDGTGGVVHADPMLPSYEFGGISTQAATAGAPVLVAESGLVVEPSWSWTPGAPVYAGAQGQLTQTPPSSGVLHQVAVAASATSVLMQVLTPITRS